MPSATGAHYSLAQHSKGNVEAVHFIKVRLSLKSVGLVVFAIAAFFVLPMAVAFVAPPLCDLIFGFDDFPLGRLLFGIILGVFLAVAAASFGLVSVRRGNVRFAWTVIVATLVFDLTALPVARFLTAWEQKKRYE